MKPKFSICVITKNEAKTLPKLFASLKYFKNRGGELVLLDTGSKDDTVNIAKGWGAKVVEVDDMFITTIYGELADRINQRFIIDGEKPVIKAGDKLFDFASARNYCATFASNDFIITLDADEAYTTFDIDRINQLIDDGYEQFEYSFVYAHNSLGKPAIEFVQCKAYDRRKMEWKCIVHEVISPKAGVTQIKKQLLDKSVIYLEHYQEQGKEHRGNYLVGLALDCYNNPDNDRNSHYFAREMFWQGRPKSAIKEFARHIDMNRWPTERAQSMIFTGDCYGALNQPDKQIEWYGKAFYSDPHRRESLIKTAEFYKHNNVPKAVAAFAAAAMEIPWADYYANNKSHYENIPHELMYWAKGWMGEVNSAKYHILKAMEYQPFNSLYIRDLRFYFKLPKVSIVIPTLGRQEGLIKCLASIKALNYPTELIETIVIEDEPQLGVPKRVKEGVERSTGDFIVFAANDTELDPACLAHAALEFDKDNKLILLAFNTNEILPDGGNKCEHFMFRKAALDLVDGEIFDTEFHHVGVDNLLWAKCERLGGAKRSNLAKMKHNHFTQGAEMDKIYELGWSKKDEDRKLLKQKLEELSNSLLKQNPGFGPEYTPPSHIEGWMTDQEIQWLYSNAKKYKNICEIGSWMGKSCHALLSGCKDGVVHSVDHYLGSADPTETGHRDVYPEFIKNVGHFKNLVIHRKASLEGVKDFEDGSLEMVFIDAGHMFQEVVDDINAWLPKTTKLICGHDYQFYGVNQATAATIGKVMEPTPAYETIWWYDLTNRLHKFRAMIDKGENFSFVKMGDGEMEAMLDYPGENCDGQKYSIELQQDLKDAFRFFGSKDNVFITKWKLGMNDDRELLESGIGFNCTEDHDLLLNRELTPYIYNFWRSIKLSKRRKIFVGPKRLEGVVKFLNIDQFIEIPEKNAYENRPELALWDSDIVLFSAGPASKVWIADILKGVDATCIDCGSAFDPLFYEQTRTNQLSKEELTNFYKDLLN
jgi:glycosyltransferase involved in cell wall biosynthesis